MSNYTKTTDFGAKDSLPTGDSGKIIRGTEFETEFDAISTAIATKADIAGPTFTGTLTYETISDGTISITAFVDEDDMSSNSANLVPTQQSVKAYVDAVTTELQAQDLDFQADTGGALNIDLDTETMTFTGGTGIDTSGSGNAVTFAIDSTVATLTGTQTLTNKTLTSPDVNTPDIDGGTIDGTVIGGATPAAVSATTVSATGNITVGGTVDGRDVATDGTKLDGIEAGATADQTAAEIRTLVEAATDSNVFTDADHSKLDGIEAGATGDQTNAEIRAAVEAATDSNVFTDADHSKLDGIEALADVTDTTNVTAAGALMDSELTNITAVKSLNQGVATTDTPTFAGLATSANVTFGDNDKAIFGAGSDLQIYHDGTHSYVDDSSGTGRLILKTDYLEVQNAAGNEAILGGIQDGAVSLFYDGNTKLATTATGIDVTGTAVVDGLTVDDGTNGVVQFGPSNARRIAAGSDYGGFRFYSDSSHTLYTNNIQRLQINSGGDISFYEDTGTTAKLFWDASAERLGIGTTSPSNPLDIESSVANVNTAFITNTAGTGVSYGLEIAAGTNATDHALHVTSSAGTSLLRVDGSGNVGIGESSPEANLHVKNGSAGTFTASNSQVLIENNTTVRLSMVSPATNACSIEFGDVNDQNVGVITYDHASDFMKFGVNASEAMRIDSSNNLLIGQSSTTTPGSGNTTSGASIRAGGSSFFSVNQGPAQYLSRNGNTGAILVFRDDNVEVGSIGIESSGFYLNGEAGHAGLKMFAGAVGARQNGSDVDATIDLGWSSGRFKDLYLSGTANASALTTTNSGITLQSSSVTKSAINVAATTNQGINGTAAGDQYNWTTGGKMLWSTNSGTTARMILDGSGNLLVGKTVNNTFNEGFVAKAAGGANITSAGDTALDLNRRTSDGTILNFRKDNTTVGSIGAKGGTAYLIGSSKGLRVSGSGVIPITTGGTNSDATYDIGDQAVRFKDLYLSGNAYIGNAVTAGTDGSTSLVLEGVQHIFRKGSAGSYAEYGRFDTSGNLLVGTSSANAKVYALNNGGTGLSSIRADNNSNNYTAHHFWSVLGGTGNDNTTAIHMAGYTASGNRFIIYGNGDIVNNNNSYGALSDLKLKENIINASSQWDDIKAVTIRKYSMKEDNLDAPNKLGVIAQELEAAGMGSLVYESPDRDSNGEILNTTTKQVKYSILYMKAVKALQEAMNRIEILEAEVTALKGEN